MAIEQKLPTRWALFECFIGIWKLRISTAVYAPSPHTMTYEYLYLVVMWGNSEKFRIRLYDTWRRIEARRYATPRKSIIERIREKLKGLNRL